MNSKTPFLGQFKGSKFVFDETKMVNYVVPDLTGFIVFLYLLFTLFKYPFLIKIVNLFICNLFVSINS